MKKRSIVFLMVFSLCALSPLTGNSTTVTVESDDFIRCLIGDCHAADASYSVVADPFDGHISGTDLGTFAKGDSYTYIFFGDTSDTSPWSTGLYDMYLVVPNDELMEFIATPEGAVTPEMNTRFLTYFVDRYEGPEGIPSLEGVPPSNDSIDYEYIASWSAGSGFNVPTGAFYNAYNDLYYIWYGVDVDFIEYDVYGNPQPSNNQDESFLFHSTFDRLPSGLPWDVVYIDPAISSASFSHGPGTVGYQAWNRPPRDPQFRLGKFINTDILTYPL